MYNIKSDIRAWLWMLVLMLVLQALPEPCPPKRSPRARPRRAACSGRWQQGYSTATRSIRTLI